MNKEKIRELNDAFRKDPLRLGKLVMTRGVTEMPNDFAAKALKAVQAFDAFDDGNDPWNEHDFIAVDVDGRKIFAKIDYYDEKLKYGSEDPADPHRTMRVMTIMLAEQY